MEPAEKRPREAARLATRGPGRLVQRRHLIQHRMRRRHRIRPLHGECPVSRVEIDRSAGSAGAYWRCVRPDNPHPSPADGPVRQTAIAASAQSPAMRPRAGPLPTMPHQCRTGRRHTTTPQRPGTALPVPPHAPPRPARRSAPHTDNPVRRSRSHSGAAQPARPTRRTRLNRASATVRPASVASTTDRIRKPLRHQAAHPRPALEKRPRRALFQITPSHLQRHEVGNAGNPDRRHASADVPCHSPPCAANITAWSKSDRAFNRFA